MAVPMSPAMADIHYIRLGAFQVAQNAASGADVPGVDDASLHDFRFDYRSQGRGAGQSKQSGQKRSPIHALLQFCAKSGD